MKRREFLLGGAFSAAALAAPQGREFRPNPLGTAPRTRRIVDIHVHPWIRWNQSEPARFSEHALNQGRPDGDYQVNPSWEQFQYDMGAVEKAVILHVARDEGRKGNDEIAGIAKKWPEKLVPFGSTNPTYSGAVEEFTRGVKQLGLKGFKLSPIYQKFHPMDPGACRIYALAEQWGIPLMFHTATAQAPDVPLRWADPLLFDDVAYAFPRLKIIMAHLGHPWQRECAVMARKHANVYLDISANFYRPWSLYNALLHAWEWGQTDKIFFGTDWPVTTPRETMDGLRSLSRFAKGGNPRIPEEVIEGIIHRDSLAVLGIQA